MQHVLDEVFGADNRIEELIWAMNTNNSQAPNYSTNHEYVRFMRKIAPLRSRTARCSASRSQVRRGDGIGRAAEF